MKRNSSQRRWLLTLLVALPGALLALAPRVTADGTEVVTSLRLPLSGDVAVTLADGTTDTVFLAGPVHIVARFVPPNPTTPTDPCRMEIQANSQGVDGSVVSGTSPRQRRYRLVGTASAVMTPVDPCRKFSARLVFTLQSTDSATYAGSQGVGVVLDAASDGSVTGGEASFVSGGGGGDISGP